MTVGMTNHAYIQKASTYVMQHALHAAAVALQSWSKLFSFPNAGQVCCVAIAEKDTLFTMWRASFGGISPPSAAVISLSWCIEHWRRFGGLDIFLGGSAIWAMLCFWCDNLSVKLEMQFWQHFVNSSQVLTLSFFLYLFRFVSNAHCMKVSGVW